MTKDRINSLIYTSVEDCRSSLQFIDDLDLLDRVLARCLAMGLKSKAAAVVRRIKQLEQAK